MIQIMIQFNGKNLTIPINPAEIQPTRTAKNDDINIVGLGNATRKGEPGLMSFTIESFFPGPNNYYYTGVKPKSCVDFINEIWDAENKNNNVAKIVTLGLPVEINMYFVIENFNWDIKAGEEEDIYFTLKIKKYVPYGVKTVNVQLSGLAAARAVSTSTGTNNSTKQTYKVQSGDCLWNITKACVGNGARYMELYNLNKKVIGSNPNLIYPGQVLTLPDGWKSPQSVEKLKSVATSTVSNKAPTGSNLKTHGDWHLPENLGENPFKNRVLMAHNSSGGRRRPEVVVSNEIGIIFTK